MPHTEQIINIPIDLLYPNSYQPRKTFDEKELKELAISIKQYGILNPILVRKVNDKYEIIAGERRYRASKMIGLKEVPIIIKQITDSELAEIALIENLQRSKLSAIEEANSYQEILKLTNLTQEQLGKKIGKSQAAIANKIRLLNLPPNIKEALTNNKISEHHARTLLKVKDPEEQNNLLKRIINEKLTVKELEIIVNQEKVTDEEIKQAINNIMKSLQIDEEPIKEEKESDNMNNGNFFPNYNNPQMPNNNVSLNTMNMQSMESQPMPAVNETVMPSAPINPIPNFQEQPTMQMPEINSEPVSTPTMQMPEISQTEYSPYMQQPAQNEYVASASVSPTIEPTIAPVIEPEPRLFDTNPSQQLENIVPAANEINNYNSSYEVPVTNISEPVQPTYEDNFTKTKNLLDQNGVAYKAYSNETGHCIIIEL